MSFVDLNRIEDTISKIEEMVYKEYIVVEKDTLYDIAKKNNSNVDELLDINDLSSIVIYPDQVLLIPVYENKEVRYYNYVTQQDDTVKRIAQNFQISPRWIYKYNKMKRLKLAENQTLSIPNENEMYQIGEQDDLDTLLRISNKTSRELLLLNKSLWLKPQTYIRM